MEIIGKSVLFIEDDESLCMEINRYFSAHNKIIIIKSLQKAVEIVQTSNFDIIVLNPTILDESEMEQFMKIPALPPVVIFSSSTDDNDILKALSTGAIDYITKPCSMRLLEAKLFLRLSHSVKIKIFSEGLTVNTLTRVVDYEGEVLFLTSSEFNILHFLITHPGKFYSADKIYEEIWKEKSFKTTTIRKHISSMRKKLTNIAPDKVYVLTDFGNGYAFAGEL